MNKQQITELLKALTIVVGLLPSILVALGVMETGPAEKVGQAVGAIVSAAGVVWMAMSKTERAMVLDAKDIQGVQVHVDTTSSATPESVVKLATGPTTDVFPMIGGPRVPTDHELQGTKT